MDSPDGNSRSTKYGVSSEKNTDGCVCLICSCFWIMGNSEKFPVICHAEIEVMTEYCIFFPAPYELFYGALFF